MDGSRGVVAGAERLPFLAEAAGPQADEARPGQATVRYAFKHRFTGQQRVLCRRQCSTAQQIMTFLESIAGSTLTPEVRCMQQGRRL